MSNIRNVTDIVTQINNEPQLVINIEGTESKPQTLPINIPVIVGNRVPKGIDTLLGDAYALQHKSKEPGKLFSWNLWRRPFAIVCSEDKARAWIKKQKFDQEKLAELETGFIDGKFYLLFDGGHRRELYIKAFPDATEWSVEVYPVSDIETAYGMFGNIQDRLMKKLTRDLLMYTDLVGGNEQAKQVDDDLFKAGLVNYANEDAIHPKAYVDDLSVPSIPVNGFLTTRKLNGSRRVMKSATDVIKEAYKDAINPNARFRVNQYVYYGVVFAMIESPELATTHKQLMVGTLKDMFRKCIRANNISVSQQMNALKLALHEHLGTVDGVNPSNCGLTIYKAVAEYQSELPMSEQVPEHAESLIADTRAKSVANTSKKFNAIRKIEANFNKQAEVA